MTPVVLAGPDIGFRMQTQKGNTPVGQVVVRIDGEWRAVEFGQVSLPLGKGGLKRPGGAEAPPLVTFRGAGADDP